MPRPVEFFSIKEIGETEGGRLKVAVITVRDCGTWEINNGIEMRGGVSLGILQDLGGRTSWELNSRKRQLVQSKFGMVEITDTQDKWATILGLPDVDVYSEIGRLWHGLTAISDGAREEGDNLIFAPEASTALGAFTVLPEDLLLKAVCQEGLVICTHPDSKGRKLYAQVLVLPVEKARELLPGIADGCPNGHLIAVSKERPNDQRKVALHDKFWEKARGSQSLSPVVLFLNC